MGYYSLYKEILNFTKKKKKKKTCVQNPGK